jgi:hypothetical protein
VISRLDSYDKVARWLIGFEGAGGAELTGLDGRVEQDGKPVGRVTSQTVAPDGTLVGLAVVKREAAPPGPARLTGAQPVSVQLCDRPFWSTS